MGATSVRSRGGAHMAVQTLTSMSNPCVPENIAQEARIMYEPVQQWRLTVRGGNGIKALC